MPQKQLWEARCLHNFLKPTGKKLPDDGLFSVEVEVLTLKMVK